MGGHSLNCDLEQPARVKPSEASAFNLLDQCAGNPGNSAHVTQNSPFLH